MPIIASELKLYRSALVSDTAASNGGRLSSNEVVTGLSNNIMPDVPQAERTAGSTKHRKVFYRNTNASNLPLLNPYVFMDKYTQGDDAVYFFAGSQTDVATAITGSEELFGVAKLDANVAAGQTSIDVLLENSSVVFFAAGNTLRISDRPTVDGAGNADIVTISGTPTLLGSVLTIAFTPALANTYTAAATRVAKVMAISDLTPAYSGTSVTSVSGTYDFAQLALTNLGTLYDTWTVTFSSPTAYSVSGANTGAVGTGNISGDFSPLNPATSVAYFNLKAAGFGGTFASGNTIVFTTSPGAKPLWVRRDVPPGATAIVGNSFTIALEGETA